MEEKVKRIEFRFRGMVQGVGFRYRSQHAANACGVTGWVHNEWDGSVLMEAQGTDRQITKMLKMIQKGMFVRIDHMEQRELAVDEHDRGFHIR